MNRPTPRPPTQSLRAQLAALRAQGWHLSGRAISQIEQHGLNPHLVVRAAAEPTESRPADHGEAVNHWRDGILVLCPADAPQTIIGAIPMSHLPPRRALRRGKSGGDGRKMPQSGHELRQQLTDKGFHVEQTSGGHLRITHQHHPQLAAITGSTPSDRRAMANLVAHLRRSTGIDITR